MAETFSQKKKTTQWFSTNRGMRATAITALIISILTIILVIILYVLVKDGWGSNKTTEPIPPPLPPASGGFYWINYPQTWLDGETYSITEYTSVLPTGCVYPDGNNNIASSYCIFDYISKIPGIVFAMTPIFGVPVDQRSVFYYNTSLIIGSRPNSDWNAWVLVPLTNPTPSPSLRFLEHHHKKENEENVLKESE